MADDVVSGLRDLSGLDMSANRCRWETPKPALTPNRKEPDEDEERLPLGDDGHPAKARRSEVVRAASCCSARSWARNRSIAWLWLWPKADGMVQKVPASREPHDGDEAAPDDARTRRRENGIIRKNAWQFL